MGLIKIVLDSRAAAKKLQALEAAFDDKQAVFGLIGNRLLNRVRLGFKLGIDPWGRKWKAVKWRAPRIRMQAIKDAGGNTIDYKRKVGKDGKFVLTKAGKAQAEANRQGGAAVGNPLRDTGRMRNSITSRVEADGVTIGTNVIYAPVHQFGATIRPKKAGRLVFPGPRGDIIFAKKVIVPARPFLPIRASGQPVVLPVSWSADVVRALRAYATRQVKQKLGAGA